MLLFEPDLGSMQFAASPLQLINEGLYLVVVLRKAQFEFWPYIWLDCPQYFLCGCS